MVTNYLNKAKKDNKVIDFKHIKVLLTGSSAAGKSSFCGLLFGSEKFSKEYKSTNILKNKQALSKRRSIEVKKYNMIRQEGEVTWYEFDLQEQIQYLKSLLVHEKFHDQGVVDSGTLLEVTQTDIDEEIVEAEPLPDSFTTDMVKLVTVVDTGGQPEYIHLLPAINSYPTVTFIVHDLTEKLDGKVNVYREDDGKKVKDRSLNFSYLNMIHLLMCFVSDTLEQQLPEQAKKYISIPEKPYIGFVGTHYDEVKNDPTIIENFSNTIDLIVNERQFEHEGILHSEHSEIENIHLVDNTTAGDNEKEGSVVKEIREQIEQLTEGIDSKTLPITWMILQLRIQQVCTTAQEGYIEYEEYTKVAKESLNDENEIKASLLYFHFSGLLLYFEDPSLCDYVIINLQWLYSNLAKVMQLSSKNVKFLDGKLKNKLDNLRLLAINDYKSKLEGINTQQLKFLLDVLKHLKVIAEVTVQGTKYFYLPCSLSNSDMCDIKHNIPENLLSEPLLIQFKSGFLPRGFFCSLVVHLLNEEHITGWKHQLHKHTENYSDLMIFYLPDGSFLYMHDKIFYLKLEVRHNESNFVSSYQKGIFIKLQKYLKMVCSHLSFDPEKLQYGFLCKANQSNDDHIAVIDLSRSLELIQKSKSQLCIQCNRDCSDGTILGKSHTIWFEQVSIYVHFVKLLYIM